MIKIFLPSIILIISLFGFMNNSETSYEALWKQVAKFEKEQLPESASNVVDKILIKGDNERNYLQSTRASLYKAKYVLNRSEDGFSEMIAFFETRISKTPSPFKQVLHQGYATILQSYLQSNAYVISQRTNLEEKEGNDPTSWSTNIFHNEITKHFHSSLENPKDLDISVKDIELLVNGANDNGTLYAPTLYDLLARKAIAYFSNPSSYVSLPIQPFKIDSPRFYDDISSFVDYNPETDDQEAHLYQAFLYYQKYLQWNKTKDRSIAIAQADLDRIKFVHNNADFEGKNPVYLNALESLQEKYSTTPLLSEIIYLKAQYIFNKSNNISRKKALEEGIDPLKEVMDLCQLAVDNGPSTKGAGHAANLHNQILQKSMQAQHESVLLPNESNLLYIRTKNITDISIRIVKLTEKEWRKIHEQGRFDSRGLYLSKSTELEFHEAIAQEKSRYTQTAEVEIPELELGFYAILVTEQGTPFDDDHALYTGKFTVSNLAYAIHGAQNLNELIVTHRKTGQPYKNVDVDIFKKYYDRNSRKQITEFYKREVTDKVGRIRLDNMTNRKVGYIFRLSKDGDRLDFNRSQHIYAYNNNERTQDEYLIFTDRAIYRPGQQIHFKVLAIHKDKERLPKILTNQTFEIEYRDANNQVIESLSLTTNEFGSASGGFTSPKGVLKGRMNLVIQNGRYNSKMIRVEEYKRPKFYAEIEPIKGEYKLLDTMSIVTHASNFAGNPVQGATIRYRINREVSFPYWGYWRYNPYANIQGQEIANGTGTLDKDGKFEIRFEATPNTSIINNYNPVYQYKISVDVTDINGETQSTESSVSVSEKTMKLSLDIPKKIDVRDLHALKISAENLNNSKVDAVGIVEIYELVDPNRVLRKRYWSQPDTILIENSRYEKVLSSYSDERFIGIETWNVGSKIFEKSFEYRSVDGATPFEIETKDILKKGAYKIVAKSLDKYGHEIEEVCFVETLNFRRNEFTSASVVHAKIEQKQYQPGEQAKLFLGSTEKNVHVYHYIDHKQNNAEQNWIELNGSVEISIPIEEHHRGGLGVHIMYVWNNRYYKEYIPIAVPWSNKDLKITYETFRNKLIPGAKETFKVKITSPNNNVLKTEMLAGMYDASLDQFVMHQWSDQTANLYPSFDSSFSSQTFGFNANSMRLYNRFQQDGFINTKYSAVPIPDLDFEMLRHLYGRYSNQEYFLDGVQNDGRVMKRSAPAPMSAQNIEEESAEADKEGMPTRSISDLASTVAGNKSEHLDENNTEIAGPTIRKNLQETVFFYPELETDEEGNISLVFTMGEALTKWKLISFVHDKELKYSHDVQEVQTQKDLMVFPNLPRFFRDGDDIFVQTKVVNMTEEELSGEVRIELLDAISGESVEHKFLTEELTQLLRIEAKGSTVKRWKLTVPERVVDAVFVRVIARAGQHSDGEENLLPVLTDRKLMTETRSVIVDGQSTKKIEFESFATERSSTLVHHKFVLEYTPNPAWYAVQALPYLMEYPHRCTEQVLNKFYANSLAQSIANSHPNIKRVFDAWNISDSDALLSNLEKNEDLKSALLKETPWLLDGMSESAAKKRIANLFDLNKMASERFLSIQTLNQRQLHDGGFPWFEGGRANRYITQYVLEGIGHLAKLNVLNETENNEIAGLISKALEYADSEMNKEYQNLLKRSTDISKDHLSHYAMHYLYIRSFYTDHQVSSNAKTAYDFYIGQAKTYGIKKGVYGGAMLSVSLLRLGEKDAAVKIKNSLLERSIKSKGLGMYWNEGNGYNWYELPIEQHALGIELMVEAEESKEVIEELKKWLLLNKQTNNWKTTKATSAAIYALLIKGEEGVSNWILEDAETIIHVGDEVINMDDGSEPASGYIRKDWNKDEIVDDMSTLTVENKSDHLGWGGVYWQYFEDLDKVKTATETPLVLKKEIYRIDVDSSGEKLVDVGGKNVNIGDKVLVRIKLKSDRSMEFVHLKDMRASGLEPLSTKSQYKWNHGLYYYESPGDLATDFFIDYLPKGNYVFEYRLVATQSGSFSNGIATIQNMYAPEYSSHSNGITLKIGE